MIKIFSDKAPAAVGPYSQGYISNGLLFCSGCLPVNPKNGKIESNDIKLQAHQSCKNVKSILESAGISFENVVKTTCFLSNINDFSEFNSVYAEYFTSKPARSCFAVKDLPMGALCEIEIIAEVK